jgi:hypothetical protein
MRIPENQGHANGHDGRSIKEGKRIESVGCKVLYAAII